MLSKTLSTSERFARLYATAGDLAEFCQSLFPLLVAHSDDFGRLQGDAFTVKHQTLPISPRSLDEFATGLQALNDVHLIDWYEVEGRRYLQIVDFDRHQSGLHKRTASHFPEIPGNSRKFPNSSEEKRREENLIPPVVPLAGGRITKRERREAEAIRAHRFGRCPHEPSCPDREACIRATVDELRTKAS